MKWFSIVSFLFLLFTPILPSKAGAVTIQDRSANVVLVQTKVATIPGFVEYLDLNAKLVGIDGTHYQLHENVKVTSKGETLELDAVSIGQFVIATIQDDLVVALTLIPQNEGF